MPCKVLLVDDHHLIREGLRRLLPVELFTVVGEASNSREALRFIEDPDFACDVCLIDYGLPDFNGVELTSKLLEHRPDLRVMLLSAYDETEIVTAAVKCGARAFVKKNEPTRVILEAVQAVATGGGFLSSTATDRIMERVRSGATEQAAREIHKLSPRELHVLRLIAQGKSTKEAAQILGLSDQTVKTHRKNVMGKLGAHNASQLLTIAQKQRLIYLSGEWRD